VSLGDNELVAVDAVAATAPDPELDDGVASPTAVGIDALAHGPEDLAAAPSREATDHAPAPTSNCDTAYAPGRSWVA
jgi:hypothetical protein